MAASVYEVYVCEMCGIIVEALEGGAGELVCCGQEMTLQRENTVDAAKEKHVPALTVNGTTATVQVGSTLHPMEAKHYILWIEIRQGGHGQYPAGLDVHHNSGHPVVTVVIQKGCFQMLFQIVLYTLVQRKHQVLSVLRVVIGLILEIHILAGGVLGADHPAGNTL